MSHPQQERTDLRSSQDGGQGSAASQFRDSAQGPSPYQRPRRSSQQQDPSPNTRPWGSSQETHGQCTGHQQSQGTSTGKQAQNTRTGQQAQVTSTGQQAQGTSARPQAQGTSTGQQAQGTSTGQQAQGTSTGQQAQANSTGQQAQATSTGPQAQGTSTGQQAQNTSTGQAEDTITVQTQSANTVQTQSISTGQQEVVETETYWQQCIRGWYPQLHSQTHFFPTIHFNKVLYDVHTVARQSVLVPQEASDLPGQAPTYFPPTGPPPDPSDPPLASTVWPHCLLPPPGWLPVPQDSDVRDDRVMKKTLDYIRDLAVRENEVMMVLSQLQFRNYLNPEADPTNAAAISQLPRPATLGAGYGDGDFDVLMISARYGLIVGEIKSVGADISKTPDLDKAVVKAVEKAIKQLNREKGLLRHLVSDMARINITTILMLPNITYAQLLHALITNPQVEMALCQCVGVTTGPAAAVQRCLCSDSLQTSDWWKRAVTDNGLDPNMTPDLYERLVARFCGPATTVDVPTVTTPRRAVVLRTLPETVALTGLTLSMLTLYPDQVDLVNRPGIQRVFLWGPPGTGKTIVLVIKGLQWGHQGKDVHLMSSHRDSRAAILLIERQLQHTLGAGSASTSVSTLTSAPASTSVSTLTSAPASTSVSTPALTSTPGRRVHTHFYDFEDDGNVEAAVEELASAARDGELFVIADEAFRGDDYSLHGDVNTSGRFAAFCTHLAARVPALHLWAAAVERYVTPDCLREERVTTPVRCPPAVLRHVERSMWIDDRRVPRYSISAAPAATEGPAVREIRHWEGEAWNYTLLPGHTEGLPENCERCADHIDTLMEELRVGLTGRDLQCRDVIILCYDPRDNLPVVARLRARGLPVQVVTSRDDAAAIRDVALAGPDAVTVTDYNVVRGLERRVVVVLEWRRLGVYLDVHRERLDAMSRCTALLVWVGEPL